MLSFWLLDLVELCMRFLPYALIALLFLALGLVFGATYGSYLQEGSDWKASDYANFWNIAGTWFGALSTTAVAALAIYFQHLAEEGRKPKLQCEFAFLPKDYGREAHLEVKIKSNCIRKILISGVCFIIDNRPIGLNLCTYSKKTPIIMEDYESELSFFYDPYHACSFILNNSFEVPTEITIASSLGDIKCRIPSDIVSNLKKITEEIRITQTTLPE